MRNPTPEEKSEFKRLLNSLYLDDIYDFLIDNPTVNINNIRSKWTGNNLYMNLLFDASVRVEDNIFQEMMRRKPNPFLVNNYNKTGAQIARDRYEQFDDDLFKPLFKQKMEIAEEYEAYVMGRNLNSVMRVSRHGLGFIPDVESKIKSYLTGQVGPNRVQMSKLRVKAGLPGVPVGGKRTRRLRRIKKGTRRR